MIVSNQESEFRMRKAGRARLKAARKGPPAADRHRQTRARIAHCVLLTVYCLLLTCFLPVASQAQYGRPPESALPKGGKPDVLKSITIEQRLNNQIPLDATFRDEAGRTVQLSEYFKDGKPVLLSLAYYECPMLCNEILNGVERTLRALSFMPGREFQVINVSFDPRETPELAARKRETHLKRLQRGGAEQGWHFLTGDKANIDRVTEAVGFGYAWDANSNQFAHASAIMIATPDGKLSHYFYGIEYAPKDVRLALVAASAGKIGSPVDQLLLYCYHYDPTTGKFAPVMAVVRTAGVLTVFGVVAMILLLVRHSRNKGSGGGDDGDHWDESVNVGGTA